MTQPPVYPHQSQPLLIRLVLAQQTANRAILGWSVGACLYLVLAVITIVSSWAFTQVMFALTINIASGLL